MIQSVHPCLQCWHRDLVQIRRYLLPHRLRHLHLSRHYHHRHPLCRRRRRHRHRHLLPRLPIAS